MIPIHAAAQLPTSQNGNPLAGQGTQDASPARSSSTKPSSEDSSSAPPGPEPRRLHGRHTSTFMSSQQRFDLAQVHFLKKHFLATFALESPAAIGALDIVTCEGNRR